MAELVENHAIEGHFSKVPMLQHNNGAAPPDKPTCGIASFLQAKKLSYNAILPLKGSSLSVGYDLFSAKGATVPARGKTLLPTDLSIAIPEGTYALVAPHSELAWKHWIHVGAGVVDADYRGPVGVILFNHSDVDFEVKAGARIAQLVIVKIQMLEVAEVDDFDSTERGSRGFGSTCGIASLLQVKKLSGNAILPWKGSPLSAGYDLFSAKGATVPARGKTLIPTDLSIAIPKGTYARVAPRSGLALKHSIHVGAGVIDADYRGPVGVVLFNHSDVDFEVKAGDRIAQLIIEKIEMMEVIEVDDLDSTERGSRGFGSTCGIASLLQVKKLSGNAILPWKGSPLSAGYDLFSTKGATVPARGKALIPTDLSIATPEGTYARVAPRSGLALKHSIDVGAGVIDADYRGPVGVILFNHSNVDFEVKAGDMIAQLIIQKIEMLEVTEVDALASTERGSRGFGSTGI